MLSYNTLNWDNFKFKNSQNLNKAFEALSYYLFCFEFNKKYGINRYFNQAGIETDPIEYNNEMIGFQAKYYDDTVKLYSKKEELKSTIKITKERYPGISVIVFYINKEFSQSRCKGENKPKYLNEIEKYAKELSIKIEWRLSSYFEKMLMEEELKYQLHLFFDPDSSEKYVDLTNINKCFFEIDNNHRIKRKLKKAGNENLINEDLISEILNKENKIVLLSDAGNGKTEECKYIVNRLNMEEYNCAFYKKINIYCGEEIKELVPQEYKEVSLENLIFVLDGFDEIANEYKRDFIIKLENFCDRYKNTRIVLTSRSNFYFLKSNNLNGTIENFSEYYLERIENDDINKLLKRENLNMTNFWNEVNKYDLSRLVHNPFFLIKIIDIYKVNNKLSNKSLLFNEVFNRSIDVDRNKFKNAIETKNFGIKIIRLLEILAITMEIIERNYLTDDEYKYLINKEDEREILEFTSVWKKQDESRWGFIHNNFGEYLAAQCMKKYSIDDIKNIVTYNGKLKASWQNTLVFLISIGREDLLDYIIDKNPEFILYIENDGFESDFKQKIIKKIFEKYENKRIWINYNVIDRFNLISNREDILYLLDKIIKNQHYTITANALSLLQTANNLYGCSNKVRDVLIEICLSNSYANYNKALAIRILADYKMCNNKEFKKIININKTKETSELRRAYYYFFKKQDLVSIDIELVLERYEKTLHGMCSNGYADDENGDDIFSIDEEYEFINCFKCLKTKSSINKVIKFFEQEKIKDIDFNKDIIFNIFDSVVKVYSNEDKVKSLFKLYCACEQHYDYKIIEAFIDKLKKERILLDFFKIYISSKNKKLLREYENIIDDECMEYFYKEYKRGTFNNQLAKDILIFCDKKINYYEKLKKEFEIKTGEKIIDYTQVKRVDYGHIKRISKNIFLEKMFDRDSFLQFVSEFLDSLKRQKINKKELHDLYDVYESDEKYYELYCFICEHFKKEEEITLKSFENWNWDWFIFAHTYKMLIEDESELELSDIQREKIRQLCDEYIKEADFKNAIKYSISKDKKISWATNILCICLWYYKYKFDFKYPQNVLLDMLEFEYYINGEKLGIDYILKEVDSQLISQRVKKNIHEKKIQMDVFENHIKYCIDNDIYSCQKDVANYFINRKLPYDERDNAYKYLINFMGIEKFINKYFYNQEEEYQNHLVPKIIELDKNVLEEWLIRRLKMCKKISKKMFYAKYLIFSGKESGLEFYLKWVNQNNMAYKEKSTYNSINDAISSINNEKQIEYLICFIKVSFKDGFKDARFDGVYNNARKALLNIASVSRENSIKVERALIKLVSESDKEKYKNIGFVYYIIDEVEQRMHANFENTSNIKTVKGVIHQLELKYKNNDVSWLEL